MFKRTIVAVITFAALLCSLLTVEAANTGIHGNGNGREDFHQPVWKVPDVPTPVKPQPKPEPVKPEVKPEPADNQRDMGGTWLIYCYFCGSDLETNGKIGTGNLQEIQQVKLPDNVKILIQTGGSKTWYHETVKGNGLWLYTSKRVLEQLPTPQSTDMGDPATLKNFLEYGEKNYPADHKVFVFWDHGGIQGVCLDEVTTTPAGTKSPRERWHILSFDQIRQALSEVYNSSPANPPFELVAFDTCLSGSYECVKSLEGFTRYVMASETETEGGKANYTPWLKEFSKNTAISGAELGRYICEGTKASNSPGWALQTNYAVIDMAKLPALTKAQDEFFAAANKRGIVDRNFYVNFSKAALSSEHYSPPNNDYYVDLGSLAQNTQNLLPEAKNLLDAVDDAVCYNLPGDQRKGMGISTFYPYIPNYMKEFESQQTALQSQKTFCNNLINNVQTAPVPQPGATTAAGQQSGSSDPYNIAALTNTPLKLDKDNHVTATLTPEQFERVSNVRCFVIVSVDEKNTALGVKDAALVFLGNDADVKIDWQTRTFTDNFRAVWPMLDGHVIFLQTDFASDEYIFYSVPVICNGEPCILKVSYSYAEKKYNIIGVTENFENGLSSGYVTPLEEGDEIAPMFLALVEADGLDSDERTSITKIEVTKSNGETLKGNIQLTAGTAFKVGKNPTIIDNPVSNGDYNYCFQFFAPDGNFAVSQLVTFTVKGGKVIEAELVPVEKVNNITVK